MPDQIKYYFKEDTNQILVSGSDNKADMNALLTSSKSPNPDFDPEYTAKISSLGAGISYIVDSNQTPPLFIDIEPNQELWVYRGKEPIGVQDANAFRYNPYLHRPYKAYILTETGSGLPVEPWLPVGLSYYGSYGLNAPGTSLTDTNSNTVSVSFAGLGAIAQELNLNGNYINPQNESGTYPPPNGLLTTQAFSGSFQVFNEGRLIHPYIMTRYNQGGNNSYGSTVYLYQENTTSSLFPQDFNTDTDTTISPPVPSDDIKFNSLTATSVTTMSMGATNAAFLPTPFLEKLQNLSEIQDGKLIGTARVRSNSLTTNFFLFNLDQVNLIRTGNIVPSTLFSTSGFIDFAPSTYLLKSTDPNLSNDEIVLQSSEYTTSGNGTGAIIYLKYRIGNPLLGNIGYYVYRVRAGNQIGQNGLYSSGDTITITAATLISKGLSQATGDLVLTLQTIDITATGGQFYELKGNFNSTSAGFNMFTNNESIDIQFEGAEMQGTLRQGQYFSANTLPIQFPGITLPNGDFTYTSSVFQDLDVTSAASSGSTQFGLYAEYGYYVGYKASLSNNAISNVTLTYTGSQNTGEYFDLQPNQEAIFVAVPGTVTTNLGGNASSNFDLVVTAFNARPRNTQTPFADPAGIFSTRVNDVYINYSSSLTQSLDGLYVFNQIPQNDVQVTASMFLNAWTGSDDGAKFGATDYGTDIYGEGEEGDGPTWPTASMRIYTGSYPNSVPNITSDFVTESLFLDENIHVNGLAVTMSYLIPSESIQIKDCLSLSLAVTSSQPLSEIDNSLIVSEYRLEFNTPTASREGDGRVPTFIENAFEGTLGFSNTPDCQPLLNNTFAYRTNGQIQEIDYSTNITNPINFQSILSGSAEKSSVPESNYSSFGWIQNRYLGSSTTANAVNTIDGLQGGYGKLPVIDYKRAYIAYCDQIIDPYPVLNNNTQFNLKYLINGQGDALNPLLSPYTALDVEGVWDEGGLGNVSISQISGSSQYDQLNGFKTTSLVAKQPLPILYSQTSSNGYADFIPLDGNPNFVSSFEQEFMQYSMRLQGSVFDVNKVNQQNPSYLNLFAGITGSGADKPLDTSRLQATFLNRFGQFVREYDGVLVEGAVPPSIIINGDPIGAAGDVFPLSPAQWTGSKWFVEPGADPSTLDYNNTATTNPYYGAPGEIFFTLDPVASASAAGNTALSDDYKVTLNYKQTQTLPNQFRTKVGYSSFWGGAASEYGSNRVGEIKLSFEVTSQANNNSSDSNTGWSRQKFKFTQPPTLSIYFGQITSTNEVSITGQPLVLNVSAISSDEGFFGGGGWGSSFQYYRTGIFWPLIQNAITSAGRPLSQVAYVEWNFQAESDCVIQTGKRYRWKAEPTSLVQKQDVINNDGQKNYFNPDRVPVKGSGLSGGGNATPIKLQIPVKGPFVNMAITSPSAEDNTEDNAINGPYWEFSQSLSSNDYSYAFTSSTVTSNPPFNGNFNDVEQQLPNFSFDSTDYSSVENVFVAFSSSLGESLASDVNQINTLSAVNNGKGFIQIANPTNNAQFFTGSINGTILLSGTGITKYYRVPVDNTQNVFLNQIEDEASLSMNFTKGNATLQPVRNTLLLKDENGNIAYNDSYYIGYLPYKPGPSTAFPGGEEPTDTAWPRPNLEWRVDPNDEIRFVNTEGQTYKIIEVISPSRNLSETGINKLKIILDRDISNGINIQFFLIRRNVYSPNTVIVNDLFPYGSLPQLTKWVDSKNTEVLNTGSTIDGMTWTSTFPATQSYTENASGSYISYTPPLRKQDNTPSGFLFPEYPIAKLEISPDEVLRDLRDKKLIE